MNCRLRGLHPFPHQSFVALEHGEVLVLRGLALGIVIWLPRSTDRIGKICSRCENWMQPIGSIDDPAAVHTVVSLTVRPVAYEIQYDLRE